MSKEQSSPLASSLGLAFFVSLAGLLLVAILSISLWKDVVWFALVYGIAVSLMAGIAVRLGGGRWGDAVLGLVVCALIGSSIYAWSSSSVRATTIQLVAKLVPTSTLFLALDDSSEEVSVAACESLLRTNYDALRHRVGEFAERTDVTVKCLSKNANDTDADELMRREVVAKWGQTLMTSNQNQCDLVGPYAALELVHSGQVATRLLRLITEAQNPSTQTCVREEFQRRFPSPLQQLQALGNPGALELRDGERLFNSLTNTTYSTTVEPAILELTSSPLMKQWGLSLGCFLMENGSSQAAYAQKLNVALSLQSCGIGDGSYSVAVWSEACSESKEGSTDGLVTTTRLCRAITRQAMIAAVGFAQSGILGGLDAVRSREMVKEIHHGTHLGSTDLVNANLVRELDPEIASPLVAMEFGYQMAEQRSQMRHELAEADKEPDTITDAERERFLKMAEDGVYEGVDLKKQMGEQYGEFLEEMNSKDVDDDDRGPTIRDLLGR